MRTPILVANWKMHKGVREATAFAEDLKLRLQAPDGVEVVIAPPFTALGALQRALQGSGIELAGQKLYPEAEGAFTGEISPAFLRDVGCRYVILGHSERRHGFGESSEFVARKVRAACDHELRPIVCVGETLEEHEAGRTAEVIEAQIRGSLAQVPPEASETLVLAYEPYKRRDGALTALVLTVHPISRYLLEVIRVDEAAVITLVGATGAGKSTLLNQLTGKDRAIVSATPGTTPSPLSTS